MLAIEQPPDLLDIEHGRELLGIADQDETPRRSSRSSLMLNMKRNADTKPLMVAAASHCRPGKPESDGRPRISWSRASGPVIERLQVMMQLSE